MRILLWITLVVILVFLALAEWVRYSVNSAGKSAKEFCDAVDPRSDVSTAIARAKKSKILYACGEEGCTFIFPIMIGFDRAVCDVAVDKGGKVLRKDWQMEFD